MSNERDNEPAGELQVEEAPPELMTEREAQLEKRVSELESQLAEARDGMLRAIADLQNFRRRAIQDAQHARESAAAALAEKLLPVLDNLERTLNAANSGASADAIVDGVRLVERQLQSALADFHVKPILAVGSPFDPHLHEAVVSEESDHDDGTIIGEIERGYKMGKKVLRPTKARVSKGRPE